MDWLEAEEAAEAAEASKNSEPEFVTIRSDNNGPLDRLAETAEWEDILVYGAQWETAEPQDRETLKAFKRPGGTYDISAKVLKANPHVLVVHSDSAGLPSGKGQKLTKGRVYAWLHYSGDIKAAAQTLARGAAVGLPPHVIESCKAAYDPLHGLYNGPRSAYEPPADSQPPELDPAAVFAEEVEREARKIRVRDAAQRKIRKENDRDYGNLNPIPLADFLAVEDEPVSYRIDRLWRRNGRVVLAAQAKAGKTTLTGNAMRSLLDGDPFLGKYQTEPTRGGVILLDFEMDDATIRQWLRDQQIKNIDRATVRPLRGKASSFDILDPQIRSEWAARIHGHDSVIVDCLRPILDALGLDENRDAGRFLTAFDELLNEAGITETLLLHHMGHTGERSRGDSRIIGWPDATWKMFRENPEDEDSPRYFSAYGRDVHSPEDELHYNPQHRRLTLTGDGSRKQAKEMKLQAAVMKAVKATPELNGTQVEAALREDGVTFQKGEERKALAGLVKRGLVTWQPGPRNSKLYSPAIQTHQSPQSPQASPRGDGEGE
jgi:hypothetical protein